MPVKKAEVKRIEILSGWRVVVGTGMGSKRDCGTRRKSWMDYWGLWWSLLQTNE